MKHEYHAAVAPIILLNTKALHLRAFHFSHLQFRPEVLAHFYMHTNISIASFLPVLTFTKN